MHLWGILRRSVVWMWQKRLSKMPEDLIELNLKVAAIAGWTDIEVWNPKAIKISYVGTNLAHPELGVHIPNYVESIDAIAKVFILLHIDWSSKVAWNGRAYASNYGFGKDKRKEGESLAIALCKLLIAINPDPIKPLPVSEKESESTVIEASFNDFS